MRTVSSRSDLDFWKTRLTIHGHTGWSDSVIYIYDQLERLKLIKAAVSQLPQKRGIALDFGCGTGDFSRLLLGMGFTVCGYDPFVRPKIDLARFSYASTYQEILATCDLILSVTTLDHILNEQELCEALQVIRSRLRSNGCFLMLEYALDSESDRSDCHLLADHQSFRTLSYWRDLLNRNCFAISSLSPVAHPLLCPSPGYHAYAGSLFARIGRRLPRSLFRRLHYEFLLSRYAAKCANASPQSIICDGKSPLKLLYCSPV